MEEIEGTHNRGSVKDEEQRTKSEILMLLPQ